MAETKSNLWIYDLFSDVPETAKKTIEGGRLNGMTSIAPMWRIKCLTEAFGPCGIGWKYTREKQWITQVPGSLNLVASVNINLFVKVNGEWSEAIPGIGGAMFARIEQGGLYVSDEAYKMAETDALSVACKLLGIGANVYWKGDDSSKYEYQCTPDSVPEFPDPDTKLPPQSAYEALLIPFPFGEYKGKPMIQLYDDPALGRNIQFLRQSYNGKDKEYYLAVLASCDSLYSALNNPATTPPDILKQAKEIHDAASQAALAATLQ